MPSKKKGAGGAVLDTQHEGTDAAAARKSGGKKSVSKAAKAGLIFPVPRVNKKLQMAKPGKKMRVGGGAPVYIAALCEFFCAEILEAACKELGPKKKRLAPEHIIRAIRKDMELNKTTKGVRILVGDKMKSEDITSALLTKEQKDARAAAKAAAAEGGEEEEE